MRRVASVGVGSYFAPMIIGHVGVAFGARARWPRIPLAWVLVATLAPDLWRLALGLAGLNVNEANRYSHLLPWSAVLALVLALAAWARSRDRTLAAVVAALVLSHVALDMVSGRKPLWLGGPTGLDVQHYQQLELVIEAALAWWGWRLLRRSGHASWVARRTVLGLLIAFEGVYLAISLWQRPYATRCIEYPVQPCWIRRHDRPER